MTKRRLLDIGNGVKIDVDEQLRLLDRADCEDNLYTFLRHAWPHVDPATFTGNWHIEAICEHLQAVVDGDIKKLLINVPPRSSKPVRVDALVSTDRGLVPLREIVVGDMVLTHKGRFRRVDAVHRQGVLPTLELRTRTGRTVHAAHDHPFLTPDGWANLGDIQKDDVVATVPQYSRSGIATMAIEEARLLGYLVGDGCCAGTPNITVADDIEAEDIKLCIEACGFRHNEQAYKLTKKEDSWLRRTSILAAEGHVHRRTTGYRGPVREFLERHGIWEMSSYTKNIPDAVMRGTDEIVANFIGAYWACDGHVSTKGAKRDGVMRDDIHVGCDSVNLKFVQQLQVLLFRLGISSIIRKKVSKIKTKRQGDVYVSYSLSVSDQDNAWRFANRIYIPHAKNGKLTNARKRRFDFDQTLRGEIVDSVEPSGEGECMCLTVEEDSSFVANGFAVHNTMVCSVAFPAWTWIQQATNPCAGPGVKFMYASYNESLSMEHSVLCRRLVKSEWYEKNWGDRFSLLSDQDTKSSFGNDHGGSRSITSVGARVTGRGAQVIVVDDANATNDANSQAMLQEVTEWWDGTIRSRLNDKKTGAFVVIQQRVAENDLSGHILEKYSDGWDHLMIPLEFEPDRAFKSSIGWEDPRKEEGEPLWPERFDEQFVAEEKQNPWVYEGQYQQRPKPSGGGILKRDWWNLWESVEYPPFDYILASADTAYGKDSHKGDYSAFTVWGVFSEGVTTQAGRILDADGRPMYMDRGPNMHAPKLMMMYSWAVRLPLHELVSKIAETCRRFKVDKLLIESKASGISVSQELRRLYANERFGVQLINPGNMDKVARVYSIQHIFAEGMVFAPNKEWAEKVILQCEEFPNGRHDDMVDTVSMAVRHLRDIGMLERAEETRHEIGEAMKYENTRNDAPLYPV